MTASLRLLGPADADAFLRLGRAMFEESRYARLGFDAERAFAYAQALLASPTSLAAGAFLGTDLVGLVAGSCGRVLPFTSAMAAAQHLLYVDPAHRDAGAARGLLCGFVEETLSRGARDVTVTNATGVASERAERLFESCGLARVGGIYVKEA